MAWGERNASERIIRNLIQNGCRYARNILEVGLSGEGNEAVLTFENDVSDFEEEDVQRIFERFYVKDEGRGIQSEHLPYLTEAFYREDKARSRNQGGAGLGLTLCEDICRIHGTTLTFESEVGQGTLVYFDLKGGFAK